MMLSRALILTLTGLTLGLTGAFALGRYLDTLLFEIKPADSVTLASVTLVLLGVALLAAMFPTARATKVIQSWCCDTNDLYRLDCDEQFKMARSSMVSDGDAKRGSCRSPGSGRQVSIEPRT